MGPWATRLGDLPTPAAGTLRSTSLLPDGTLFEVVQPDAGRRVTRRAIGQPTTELGAAPTGAGGQLLFP